MSDVNAPLWPKGEPPEPAFCAEDARVRVLSSYGSDRLEDDPELSEITQFAAELCEAPMAMVTLVEQERQLFLAREGTDLRETPRPTSFCAHAMLGKEPLVVTDASSDPRFSDYSLVTHDPQVRFYAGVPLVSREGAPLGALCVVDTKPRAEGLSDLQIMGLKTLASAVMRRLRYSRDTLEQMQELDHSAMQLRTLANSLPDVAWSADGKGRFDYFNDRFFEITGLSRSALESQDFESIFHPDDGSKWRDIWRESLKTGEPYEAEYRLRYANGEYRWSLARALPMRSSDGEVERWFGTITDVDDKHREVANRELLARELSHRIKNIFAVVTGLISLKRRSYPEAEEFAEALSGSILALSRANDFVRPSEEIETRPLEGLLAALMAPYTLGRTDRIAIDADPLELGQRAVTPLALIFHELATNAAKYGALSTEMGKVAIEGRVKEGGERVFLLWRETNGPPPKEITEEGFGSRMVKLAVEGQLKGSIERTMHEDGLELRLDLSRDALTG